MEKVNLQICLLWKKKKKPHTEQGTDRWAGNSSPSVSDSTKI